jgi:hypothetical protein
LFNAFLNNKNAKGNLILNSAITTETKIKAQKKHPLLTDALRFYIN